MGMSSLYGTSGPPLCSRVVVVRGHSWPARSEKNSVGLMRRPYGDHSVMSAGGSTNWPPFERTSSVGGQLRCRAPGRVGRARYCRAEETGRLSRQAICSQCEVVDRSRLSQSKRKLDWLVRAAPACCLPGTVPVDPSLFADSNRSQPFGPKALQWPQRRQAQCPLHVTMCPHLADRAWRRALRARETSGPAVGSGSGSGSGGASRTRGRTRFGLDCCRARRSRAGRCCSLVTAPPIIINADVPTPQLTPQLTCRSSVHTLTRPRPPCRPARTSRAVGPSGAGRAQSRPGPLPVVRSRQGRSSRSARKVVPGR